MISIQESRKYFSYLESEKIYFNHAAISPLPIPVRNKIDEYFKIRSETEIEPYFKTLDQAIGAKEKLAKMLNVESNYISWAANVSSALNILAQGIDWNNGDEIILNNIEFPSNIYPFLNLQKNGVNILFAEAEYGKVDLLQIEKLITDKTRLISISMVQFLTGYRADLKAIGDLCKSKNIIFCVDGIQGAGIIQTDLIELNIDFFAGGSHKWLMGLQGLGYFYISERLLQTIKHINVGWTSVKNPWNLLDYNLDLIDSAESFQNGTLPRIGIIALNASLTFFEEIGFANIENRILENSKYLRSLLSENGFELILKDTNEKKIAGIVSFYHSRSEEIVKKLEEKNIVCSVREGVVRLSPHFYNSREEFEQLIGELNIIVKQ